MGQEGKRGPRARNTAPEEKVKRRRATEKPFETLPVRRHVITYGEGDRFAVRKKRDGGG